MSRAYKRSERLNYTSLVLIAIAALFALVFMNYNPVLVAAVSIPLTVAGSALMFWSAKLWKDNK